MNSGKTLFAQVMEFVPWTSFARIAARYSGDARVSTLRSAEHFRIMAYAQLTWVQIVASHDLTLVVSQRACRTRHGCRSRTNGRQEAREDRALDSRDQLGRYEIGHCLLS